MRWDWNRFSLLTGGLVVVLPYFSYLYTEVGGVVCVVSLVLYEDYLVDIYPLALSDFEVTT